MELNWSHDMNVLEPRSLCLFWCNDHLYVKSVIVEVMQMPSREYVYSIVFYDLFSLIKIVFYFINIENVIQNFQIVYVHRNVIMLILLIEAHQFFMIIVDDSIFS